MKSSNSEFQSARAPVAGQKLAEFLNRNRTYILFALLAALAFNFGYWAITNLLSLFWNSRVGPWVESTLLAAEIGLAIGTLALASGGLLQSRAAGIQLEVSARQERVAAQLIKPHLDFQVLEAAAKPTTQDTIVVGPNQWFIHCRLRNLGPGVAVELQVTAFDWMIDSAHLDEELRKLSASGPSKEPILTPPMPVPKDIVNVPFALVAGEGRDFGLQFRIPPLPEKMTGFVQQTVVIAWAKDIEGGEVPPKRLGLRLDFAFPRPAPRPSEPPGIETLWRWLADEEITKIRSLPAGRVSRKSHWWPRDPPDSG